MQFIKEFYNWLFKPILSIVSIHPSTETILKNFKDLLIYSTILGIPIVIISVGYILSYEYIFDVNIVNTSLLTIDVSIMIDIIMIILIFYFIQLIIVSLPKNIQINNQIFLYLTSIIISAIIFTLSGDYKKILFIIFIYAIAIYNISDIERKYPAKAEDILSEGYDEDGFVIAQLYSIFLTVVGVIYVFQFYFKENYTDFFSITQLQYSITYDILLFIMAIMSYLLTHYLVSLYKNIYIGLNLNISSRVWIVPQKTAVISFFAIVFVMQEIYTIMIILLYSPLIMQTLFYYYMNRDDTSSIITRKSIEKENAKNNLEEKKFPTDFKTDEELSIDITLNKGKFFDGYNADLSFEGVFKNNEITGNSATRPWLNNIIYLYHLRKIIEVTSEYNYEDFDVMKFELLLAISYYQAERNQQPNWSRVDSEMIPNIMKSLHHLEETDMTDINYVSLINKQSTADIIEEDDCEYFDK